MLDSRRMNRGQLLNNLYATQAITEEYLDAKEVALKTNKEVDARVTHYVIRQLRKAYFKNPVHLLAEFIVFNIGHPIVSILGWATIWHLRLIPDFSASATFIVLTAIAVVVGTLYESFNDSLLPKSNTLIIDKQRYRGTLYELGEKLVSGFGVKSWTTYFKENYNPNLDITDLPAELVDEVMDRDLKMLRYNELHEELDRKSILHTDYLPVIGKLIYYIEHGRANTLERALYLYHAENRYNVQAELYRRFE